MSASANPLPRPWLATRTLVSYDVPATYDCWLRAAGVTPYFVGPDEALPDNPAAFGALLLTGGGDVNPGLYGAEPHPLTGDIAPQRDALEQGLIRRFLDAGRPIFGICRGIQILNVVLGGGLVQHVPDWLAERGSAECHSPPQGDAVHALRVAPDSLLGSALGSRTTVNSHHHQAADPHRVGCGLRAVAWSEAGVVEALEGVGLPAPVLAVQWHPERLGGENAAEAQAVLRLMLGLAST